ncbi:SPFH domain-containing protein [Endozoicomonas sp.]|uniref:SPFH domain-containing protein n=1 Tax=Endozoicomonas sp. TaxID=1892382 RepID=UPI002887F1C2|nr:SPFH domain-containing protein [Endozoicomonas sp.]
MNKLLTILMIGFLFSQLPVEKTEAADFYSYIPFLYQVPVGSVGVFKKGKQFYDDVYPAGVYTTWPFDEGFNISIIPEKTAVTEIPCITVEGIKIIFPKITVHYQIPEDGALELVKHHGVDFLEPLIKKPVRQGVADLCSTMTAEAVYLEKFAILKQYMTDYLAREQGDKESGLSIGDLGINRPRVSDEILENFVGRKVSPVTCDQPYEIFYTLEDEKEARERLCGSDSQHVEIQQNPVPEDDMTRVVEPDFVTVGEPVVLSVDTYQENPLQPDHEMPSEGLFHQQVIDPLIDGEDSYDVKAEPTELTQHLVQDDLERIGGNTESVNNPGFEAGRNPAQSVGQGDEQSPQGSLKDRRKASLYQQMQGSKGLWKNNNSLLYLTW